MTTGQPDAAYDAPGAKTEHCMICGETLVYHEKAIAVTCAYCRQPAQGYIVCPNGHYLCDRCHNRDSLQVIADMLAATTAASPFAIAELAMSLPSLPMLGCQHAFIAGGALMAALKNEGAAQVADDALREVFLRTEKQAHGGYCGLTGVCGIVPAIGACFAVLTGSKCGTDAAQRTTMEAAGRVSRAITGLTGPSCCKAYVRAALKAAVDFLAEHLGIQLPSGSGTSCRHSAQHPHGCRQSRCPYFVPSSGGK